MLAEDAIKSAISNYYTKNPKAKVTDLGGTGAAMPQIILSHQKSIEEETSKTRMLNARLWHNC
jgi:hypothetical protein